MNRSSRVSGFLSRAPLAPTMLISLSALLLGVLGACGPDGEEVVETPGELGLGGACEVQSDCFACNECRGSYAEVCVDATCWLSGAPDPELDLEDPEAYPLVGGYNVYIELPKGVDAGRIRSAAIRVLHPLRTDGSEVTCEELLVDPVAADEDESLNFLRVLQPALILNTGDDVAVPSVGHIPVGPDRLFLVRLHTQNRGEGRLLAKGCTASVEVISTPDSNERVAVETVEIE